MSTTKLKTIALLFFCSLLALAYAPVHGQNDTHIRMGLYENPPLEFTNENGQADGFVITIFNFIADQQGWQIDYVPCVWNDCLAMLESGDIDLMGAIAFSSERAQRFDFNSEFLITNWGQLYTRPEDAGTTLLDLEGQQIAALPEDIYLTGIQQTLANFHVRAKFQPEDSYEQILQAVDDGRVYAGVINHLFALQHAAEFDVSQTAIIFSPIEIHFAATKGKHLDLLTLIDGSLRQLKNDADSIYYQQINNWFSSKSVVFSTPVWVRNASIALIVAVLLFSGATFFFRAEVNRKTAALQAAHQRLLTVLESIDA
ncbi:MAG: transporter substrate-binding domain-containing protein, partial [Anaerolineae bacterium]